MSRKATIEFERMVTEYHARVVAGRVRCVKCGSHIENPLTGCMCKGETETTIPEDSLFVWKEKSWHR